MEGISALINPVPQLENYPPPPRVGEEARTLNNWLFVNQTIIVSDAGDKSPAGSELGANSPNCLKREQSTVSSQALNLMNSQFVLSAARRLAARLIDSAMTSKNRSACYISRPSAVIRQVKNGRRPLRQSLRFEKNGRNAWNRRRS